MAKMIPKITSEEEFEKEFEDSYGEGEVYRALEQLPDEWIVFHSIDWSKKDNRARVRWGEADFIVYNPHRGILVIEVKPGLIECSEQKMIQINRMTNERKEIKPVKQAQRCKSKIREILEEKDYDHIWVELAVWFPSVDKKDIMGNLPHSFDEAAVLFKEDMKKPKVALDRAFENYRMLEHIHFDNDEAKEIVEILAPEFKAVPSMVNIAEEQNYYFNRLTREQSYLMDYLEEQKIAAIQGTAGTGKTMLAIAKAKRFSKEEQVVFLCFNKLLVDDLKSRFAKDLPNVSFTNLYSLVGTAMHKEVKEDDIEKYLENFEKYNWPYKHIIVDEGQDFSEEQIRLLHDIAILTEGSFYVFYDKNQLVQQRNALSWAKDIECRLVLTRNCRNTKSIAETSGIPINFTNIKMRLDIPGRKPNLYIVKTEEEYFEVIKKLIRYYTDAGFKKEQITILTYKTIDDSLIGNRTSIGNYRITNSREKNAILFTTAKKFKGLESDIIIFTDVSSRTFKSAENRRIFYVGSSRAKNYLDYVSLLNDEEEKDMAEELIGVSKKNPRISIMGALKVKIARAD